MKHPQDKHERRSIEAKALEKRMFRQRKIDAKKRKIKTEIEDQETQDELRTYSRNVIPVELGGLDNPEAV